MRILLDECTPRRLKLDLPGLDVEHASDLGWQGRRNGRLLASMREDGFTVDGNLQFQQNIPTTGLIVVVLHAVSNRLHDLRPLMPAVREIIAVAKPGNVYRAGV